jgi:hypothetical protein
VIFHSYVKLPEGKLFLQKRDVKNDQLHIQESTHFEPMAGTFMTWPPQRALCDGPF